MTERPHEHAPEEIEDLRSRLQEAEETLRAIRKGEVDALVVTERQGGERVYTLRSADRPYRLMIEGMRQGAVTLTPAGVVLYCNACFAGLVKVPLSSLAGSSMQPLLDPASQCLFQALLEDGEGQAEVELRASDGTRVPSYLSLTRLPLIEDEEPVLCLVVTDLTEQKRNEQIVADERLTRSILEEVAEAMVVCDRQGMVLQTSREIHRLSERNVLFEPFAAAFPLEIRDPAYPDVESFLAQPLAGRRVRGVEASLPGPARRLDLIVSASPFWGPEQRVEGCVVTFVDITERRQAERELERAWAAAEAMNEAKDRFLATLSHELRTPLTPVLATISSLEASSGELPDRLRNELAMIRRNIELEARLIDDLLDLTRISRGKLELQRQETDLRQVLDHAVRISCGEHIASGRLQVEIDLPETDQRLWVDPSRLTQVFWNLLNNAVKFTPEGGSIRVRSWQEPEARQIVVEVSDTGVGIEPELLPRIFDAFEQGEPGAARQAGLGLGLAISRAIVELHRGEISVRSDGKGQGATFRVRLPVVTRPADTAPFRKPEATAAQHAPAQEVGRPLTILLVEDHPDTANALAELLRISGHGVAVANSVAEALATARTTGAGNGGIDLVISDLGLPDGSGLELMRELSSRYGLRGIALSGYGMDEDVRKSRDAGFLMHITKPVNVHVLEEAILRTLAETAPSAG